MDFFIHKKANDLFSLVFISLLPTCCFDVVDFISFSSDDDEKDEDVLNAKQQDESTDATDSSEGMKILPRARLCVVFCND